MSTLNLTFDRKVALTILTPVVIGIFVHKTPKVLSYLFPSELDGKVAELSRNKLRLLFDRYFRKIGEDDQRFISGLILDNAGIAAFLTSYEHFKDRNVVSLTTDQRIRLFSLFFALMVTAHVLRATSCWIIAPIMQKAGGEALAKIFRSLGPSDSQVEIVDRQQNLNNVGQKV